MQTSLRQFLVFDRLEYTREYDFSSVKKALEERIDIFLARTSVMSIQELVVQNVIV